MATLSCLKKLYFSRLGQLVSKKINPVIRWLKCPRMLWGYQDASGQWRIRTRMSDTVFLSHPENIHIGEDVFVWHYAILDGTGGLKIGRGTQVGAWVGLFTHSSHIAIRLYGEHYHKVPEQEKVAFGIKPIEIGDFVFIAAAAIILPGVRVGNGALISTGAVVNKDVAPYQIMAGNPARVIGDTRKIDSVYLEENPDLKKWYKKWQVDAAN